MDGRVLHARRVAIGAACGGGGLGLLSAAFYGLLLGQANLARRAIQPLEVGPPPADGRYLPPSGVDSGTPVRLALRQPALHLARDPQGRWNLPPAAGRGGASGGGCGRSASVHSSDVSPGR